MTRTLITTSRPVASEGAGGKAGGGRWRRWLKVGAVLAVIVLLIAASVGWWLLRPVKLRGYAVSALEKLTAAEVEVGSVRWVDWTHLELRDVWLRVPESAVEKAAFERASIWESERARRLAHLPRAGVELSVWGLVSGGLPVRRVALERPMVYLTEDVEDGRYQLSMLPRKEGGGGGEMDALPEVRMEEAAVIFARVDAGGVTPTRAVMLAGRLVREEREEGVYRLSMHEPGGAVGEGEEVAPPEAVAASPAEAEAMPLSLEAVIDLNQRKAEVSVEGFAVASLERDLWPTRVRRELERLDLGGWVGRVNLTLEAPKDEPPRLTQATFAVEGVAMNIPHPEREDGPEVAVRMTDVTGPLRFDEGGIHTQGLTGEIGGIRYRLEGSLAVTQAKGPLDLRVVIEPSTIPEAWSLVYAMPEQVVKQFDRFQPSGRFAGEIRLRREVVDGPLKFAGEVDVLDAAGEYERFALPIHNMKGRVLFSDAGVAIESLRGTTAQGGTLDITGTVTGHAEQAEADLSITARGVTADPSLLAYLDERERRVLAKFFDEAAYQRYIDAGLLAAESGEREGGGFPYPFALGGAVDLDVQVQRRPGREDATQSVITLRPAASQGEAGVGPGVGVGVGVMFDEFPYPVFVTGGSVVIERDLVSIRDITVRSLTGGTGRIDGEMVKRADKFRPEISLMGKAIEMGPMLVLASPKGSREVLTSLHLGGTIDITGRVYEDVSDAGDGEDPPRNEGDDVDAGGLTNAAPTPPPDRTLFTLRLTPRDATVSPYDGRFTFGEFTGDVEVTRDRVTLHDLRGRQVNTGPAVYPTKEDFPADESHDADDSDNANNSDNADADTASPLPPAWIDAADPPTVAVDGDITIHKTTADTRPRFDLRFSADDMPLDVRTLSLVPPDLEIRTTLLGLARDYRPAGIWDGSLTWQTRDTSDTQTVQAITLTARPRIASLDWNGGRVDLTRMSGSVIAQEHVVELEKLSGTFDGGSLSLDGLLTPSPDRGLAASLNITGRLTNLTDPARALLPQAAVSTIDGISLRGPVRLLQSRLLIRPPDPDASADPPPAREFEGRISLDAVNADVGVVITGLRGRADIAVTQPASPPAALKTSDAEPEPIVALSLDASTLRAAGRRISPLSLTLQSEPGQRLRITQLTGQTYGGQLAGEGSFRYDDTPAYALRLTLSDAAFEPILEADADASGEIDFDQIIGIEPDPDIAPKQPAPPVEPPSDAPDTTPGTPLPERDPAAGFVSARLLLEGRVGEPDSRRGRGAIEVRSASLFDQPLTMALLQTANLSLPTARSFHQASLRFAITGQTLRFNHLNLAAGSVQIVGSGRYEWDQDQLALTMLTRNPGVDRLGPIGDVINSLKDELITIEITGPLDNPQTRVISLDTFRRTLDALLGR